jgi:hypothetical protein
MSSSSTPPPPAPSPGAATRTGANTLAVIGLALAVLALVVDYLSLSNLMYQLGLGAVDNFLPVLISLAAIVVGHIALAQAGRFPPGQGRRGLAITALALGYLSLVVFLVFIGLLLFWFFKNG